MYLHGSAKQLGVIMLCTIILCTPVGRKAGMATMSLFGEATVTKDSIYDFKVKVG